MADCASSKFDLYLQFTDGTSSSLHLFKKIYKLFMVRGATDIIDYADKNLIYKNMTTVYSGNNSIPTFTLVLISDNKLFHHHSTMNV